MASADVDARSRALKEIVTLARTHQLSGAEIAAAVADAPAAASDNRARRVVVRVLGVLGGIFRLRRRLCLHRTAVGSHELRVSRDRDAGPWHASHSCWPSWRAASHASRRQPLPSCSSRQLCSQLECWSPSTSLDREAIGVGRASPYRAVMAVQFGSLFGSMRRSTTLLIAVLFAALFWWTTFDLLNLDDALVGLLLGAMLLLAAVGAARFGHRDITPPMYFVGAVMFLYGFFEAVEDGPVEVLFLAVAAGFVYLSVILHSRTLLVVATLAILAYTGYFTSEHFADSIGWPVSLIAFGLFMIGLSALALRIDRDYVRQPPPVDGA